MDVINSTRFYRFLSLCFLVFATLLLACSTTTYASSNSGDPSQRHNDGSTGGSATSTVVTGSGTANGCPSNAVVTNAPAANVVVKSTQTNQTISAHKGDIIEMQLPFGQRWTGPTTSQGILQLQGPAGYASKSASACIWRFVASGTGMAQLVFHSQALCQAGQLCPMYINTISFDFSIE